MSIDKSDIADRMKQYEMAEAGRHLIPLLPAIARIDGRGFSGFTAGMRRPYDKRMSDLMIATTKYLVHETNACVGYTQSDEITLAWYAEIYDNQIFFAGRIQKMVSQLAALASVYFNDQFYSHFDKSEFVKPSLATFDARVWNVPNIVEGANCFLWREQDATKNSISMAARTYFEHEEIMNKNGKEMQEMLWKEHFVNWNDYPEFFKRGTYVQKKSFTRPFTSSELELLPEKHEARRNPDLLVERTEVRCLYLPQLSKITNRADVLFFGVEPVTSREYINTEGE